jgi:hypothetical protein
METGPHDTSGSTETAVHAANANGVRKRQNILLTRFDNTYLIEKLYAEFLDYLSYHTCLEPKGPGDLFTVESTLHRE